jgi:hypothetical protein
LEASSSDPAVSVALAEFNALRAEILGHISAGTTVVGLGVTALGIIVGLVAKEGADRRLLLVIPPLSLFVILLLTAENYRTTMLGNYIRDELWPFLEERVGALPSWEAKVSDYRGSRNFFAKLVVIDPTAITLFLLASVASLSWVHDPLDPLWATGVAMVLAAFAAPVAVALRTRPRAVDRLVPARSEAPAPVA